jgi:hypothetical protein
MTEYPNTEAAMEILGRLARQAKELPPDAGRDQDLAMSADVQRGLERVITTAAVFLDEVMGEDRTLATYVLACWLDTVFPSTLVATYAARRTFASLNWPSGS